MFINLGVVMQRNVVVAIRASVLLLSFVAINFSLTVNAMELDVTGYSTLLGSYTDSTIGKTYEHDYADKYLNFTHQSRAGIQFNSKINDNFEFSLTLLMEGADNYQARADWFYATYEANEDLHFRFGRLKVPFYMVSNYIDVGHAYPWVTPPQEVYSTNLIHSADGVELVYDTTTSGGINFLFELYFGTSKNEDILSPAIVDDDKINKVVPGLTTRRFAKGDKVFFDADNMVGFEALVSTGSITLRTGYYQALIDAKEFNITGERTSVASIGLIIDWHHLLIYSEAIVRDSSDTADVLFADQEASYITLGYRFDHFLPYMTSAQIDGGANESIHALRQTSFGVGFRYEINESTDFKFEVINVKPTSKEGDIDTYGLFDNATGGETANIYAMTIDILF